MNCSFCGRPVDPTAPTTVQRVIGWEKRALSASRRGGSDILLRERLPELAHNSCVELQKAGVSVGQESMSL